MARDGRPRRPRNAMACVLTPFRHFEAVKKAAATYPDVVIPYGDVSVDDPRSGTGASAVAELNDGRAQRSRTTFAIEK